MKIKIILLLSILVFTCKESATKEEQKPFDKPDEVEESFVEVEDLSISEGSILDNFHHEHEYTTAELFPIRKFLKENTTYDYLSLYSFEPENQGHDGIRQSVKRFSFEVDPVGKVKYSVQTTDMDSGEGIATSMRCLEYKKEFVDCLLQLKPDLSKCTEDVAKLTSVIIRIKDKYLAWTDLTGLSYIRGPGKSFNSKGNLSNFKKAFKIAMKENPEVLGRRSDILSFPVEDREFFMK
ncbi:MAG: hypothetical protein O9346_17855 [Leptospiraceae bacterium]|nr:hypothetical protein [Leptospiraceae bacterium]MCZ8348280.1 hypothetical protein [Leptospiraceae bacterium]